MRFMFFVLFSDFFNKCFFLACHIIDFTCFVRSSSHLFVLILPRSVHAFFFALFVFVFRFRVSVVCVYKYINLGFALLIVYSP